MLYSVDTATFAGVLVENSPSLNPTQFVAIESWVKPQVKTPTIVFDNSSSGATFSYFMSIDGGTGKASWFSTIGGVGKNIVNVTGIIPGVWNFVSGFYDGSGVYLCANGQQIGTVAATGDLGTNPGQLRLGQYFNVGVPSFCRMTSSRVLTRSYSLADHRSRYYDAIDNAEMRTGLSLDFTMNEGSGTVVADSSGLSNNGTFSRNVWAADTPFKVRSVESGRVSESNRSSASSRVQIT